MFAAAQGAEEGAYALVVAGADGIMTSFQSEVRGHGVAVDPSSGERVAMFARRPGRIGLIGDLRTGRTQARFEAPSDRHHSGHGCFSADGSVLFVVEADVVSGRGVLAVLDADTLKRRAEYETHGRGPHEVVLSPDGTKLVVANGGLVTEPGEREPINLDTMESSLVVLDSASGERLEQHVIAEPKASLRHLAVAQDGTIAVAIQLQRAALTDTRPRSLIAVQRPGEDLRALEDGAGLGTVMEDYAGAIAIDDVSRTAALTSPRGNVVAFWDLDSGSLRGTQRFDDVSGVAVSPADGTFFFTGSDGQVRQTDTLTLEELSAQRQQFAQVRWDNHVTALPL